MAFALEIQHSKQHFESVKPVSFHFWYFNDGVHSEMVEIYAELCDFEIRCARRFQVFQVHVKSFSAIDDDVVEFNGVQCVDEESVAEISGL